MCLEGSMVKGAAVAPTRDSLESEQFRAMRRRCMQTDVLLYAYASNPAAIDMASTHISASKRRRLWGVRRVKRSAKTGIPLQSGYSTCQTMQFA